ncbi:MAG: TetR family transcriptional regulator [Actinomycetia bacterium]|nr:TetR family transcriptional regulator [Actinomycetes bacterium]
MPKPDNRRDEILHEASKLFAAKGISSTTVREIGDAVGMLSGSLYHHFPSKDAMVTEIINGYLDDLQARYARVAALNLAPIERLETLILESFKSVELDPEACEIYQNEYNYLRTIPALSNLGQRAKEIQNAWIDTLEEGAARGIFRPDIDAPVCYRFIGNAIWPTARWPRAGRSTPIDHLVRECTTLFMRGLELNPAPFTVDGATTRAASV